jgi:hypothetical protein
MRQGSIGESVKHFDDLFSKSTALSSAVLEDPAQVAKLQEVVMKIQMKAMEV